MKIRVLAAALLCAASLSLPQIGSAHTALHHSEPAANQVVAAPAAVKLWFEGAIEPAFSQIYVEDAQGKAVTDAKAKVEAANSKLLELALPTLPAGTYTVTWSVVAHDGHRAAGKFSFTVK